MVKQKLLTALIVIAAFMLVPSMVSATDCSGDKDYYGCGTPLGDFLHKLFGNTSTSLLAMPGSQEGVDIQAHASHPGGFTLRAGVGAIEVVCDEGCTTRSDTDHDLHFHVDTGYEFDTGPVALSAFVRLLHLNGGHFGYGTGFDVSLSRRAYVRAVLLHDVEDPNPQDGRAIYESGDVHLYYGFRF